MAAGPEGASPAVSLPQGGGAIQGIGETFQPDLFTGTGNFTVPIATSPGRAGFGPKLALQYSSGAGNGPFGLGWQLSLPRISRKTEKGLPRYDASDVFVLSGAEDLVPKLVDGGLQPETLRRDSYTVDRFRPRTEGLFARIERWTRDDGEVHWRTTTRDNVTSVFGRTAAARIADPDDPARVATWLLQETFDAKGNHVLYEYAAENPDGGAPAIFEENRVYCQRYIRRVLYGNSHRPVGPRRTGVDHRDPLAQRDRNYLLEVLFDYGDLAEPPADPYVGGVAGQIELTTGWPLRDDPFSDYRYGFEFRTLRRCTRVLMIHHFTELGGPTLVRSTDLAYASDPNTRLSLLVSVTSSGYRRDGAGYRSDSMPAVTLGYSQFRPHEQRYRSVQARGDDLPPRALNAPDFALVDLFGDGLPDVLHGGPNGFRYWRNLGEGILDRPRFLEQVPAGVALSQPGVGFGDVDGDGRADLLVHGGAVKGFYASTADGTWDRFRAYPAVPSFDLNDPRVRLLDLTGDGRSDALMTTQHHFLWFEGLAADGFASPRVTERVHDLDHFPDVHFDEPSGRVRLADMNGDGLVDIVLLHDGRVDYWPSLGYGRFGRRITMANAPRLPHDVNPRRLLLADLDGTGCSDLVYVEHDRVHFWFNQSGNGWSDQQTILGTPPLTDADSVQLADIFGTGTATLVWSYDYQSQPDGNYKALDFCGGVKPYVLTSMANSMGATTRVRYAPSTKFARADEAAGQPWATKLPFPVQVAEKVETIDHVGRSKLVSIYSYHHGFFDGREREFRGFGRVDRHDAETFEQFAQSDLHGAEARFDNARQEHHAPPVLTRTWFHTGAYYEEARQLDERYREEHYAGDLAAFRLEDPEVEPGITLSEAYRALRGSALRTEVYGLDGTANAPHPYLVTETSYHVRELQPKAVNAHAVYLTMPRESLTYHYERDPRDPRVGHEITVETDDFGNVVKRVAIGYPRRGAPSHPEQGRLHALFTWNRFINTPASLPLDAGHHHVGVVCETRTFEITGADALRPSAGLLTRHDLAAIATDPDAFSPYEQGASGPGKRMLDWKRTYFRADAQTDRLDPPDQFGRRLALGRVEPLGLTYETYQAVFTPGLLQRLYGGDVDDADLRGAGYVKTEDLDGPAAGSGYWWMPSGRRAFEAPTTGFCQQIASQDPFGARADTAYDDYRLLVTSTADPLGNVTRARHDYRALQPDLLTDPNRNRTAVAFDTLGRIVATALMGKEGDQEGDSLAGFDPDPGLGRVTAHFQDPFADPHGLLGQATTRLIYDLHAFERDGQPAGVCSLMRETHVSDLGSSGRSAIQQSFVYSDGAGRVVQIKTQAEPDRSSGASGAPRWVGTGWTVLNNKGKAVRQYEPFFSGTPAFEFAVQQGVSATLLYDPIGRLVCRLHPNHTYSKLVSSAWTQVAWDVNDTALVADPSLDPDVGALLARLPVDAYLPTWYAARVGGADADEQDAAQKAAGHADTPTTTYLDTLGRAFLTVADNGPDQTGARQFFESRVVLDVEGNDLAVTDPRGVTVVAHGFDMARRKLTIQSTDAGRRRGFADVFGQTVYTWDAADRRTRTEYDAARRPTRVWLAEGSGEVLIQETVYGESSPAAEANNRRRRTYQVRHGAGVVTNERYDFKGNAEATRLDLAREYKSRLDWSTAVQLEPVVLRTVTKHDALNRVVSARVQPDAGGQHDFERRPTYNAANLLESLAVRLPGASAETVFVASADYDAQGQRQSVTYGNGVTTQYEYERETLRLRRAVSRRASGSRLQDLTYTYDPMGNITRLHDAALPDVFNDNQQVRPRGSYTYDPLYRLVVAEGREHVGMTDCHYRGRSPAAAPCDEGKKHTEFVGLSSQPVTNGQALRGYRESYTYDAAGNLAEVRHAAGPGGSWTRSQGYAPLSNRLVGSDAGCPGEAAFTFPHDGSGNVTALPHVPTLTWNEQGQLRSADLGSTSGGARDLAYYTYDAAGMRVRKVVERGGTRSCERIYLGGFELYREYNGSGLTFERQTIHILDDEGQVALVERRTVDTTGREAGQPDTRVRYQLANTLGSALLEVDETSQARTIGYEEFYPYGGTAYLAGTSWTEVKRKRYRYCGKERDDETGLYYFGARYYAPWLGRWISPDPKGLADGLNLFLFAHANPVCFKDERGYATTTKPKVEVTPFDPTRPSETGVQVEGFKKKWDEPENLEDRWRWRTTFEPLEEGLADEERTKRTAEYITEIRKEDKAFLGTGSTAKLQTTPDELAGNKLASKSLGEHVKEADRLGQTPERIDLTVVEPETVKRLNAAQGAAEAFDDSPIDKVVTRTVDPIGLEIDRETIKVTPSKDAAGSAWNVTAELKDQGPKKPPGGGASRSVPAPVELPPLPESSAKPGKWAKVAKHLGTAGKRIVAAVPVVGAIAGQASAAQAVAQGDYVGAALDEVGNIPIAGDLLDAGRAGYAVGEAINEAFIPESAQMAIGEGIFKGLQAIGFEPENW